MRLKEGSQSQSVYDKKKLFFKIKGIGNLERILKSEKSHVFKKIS